MELIKITNLSKSYKTSKNNVEVLKDVNLNLPKTGLIIILGKSGSGKSTLLNIIGGIDKPSKGKITYNFSKKISSKVCYSNISFIFQHYHLLENETPMYNVMLPALIQGFDKTFAEKQARELFSLFGLDENIINKKTKLLSGGEKERIAVLRALITNPKLILADEPTGALDIQNAIKTMDILKKASKRMLVILVTHNQALAREYGDRIITISDGKIINDEKINDSEEEIHESDKKLKGRNNWSSTIVNHNFKKRIKRHIVSTIGMTISLIFCYFLFGFTNQSSKAIDEVSEKHLDYGTCVIRKEIVTPSSSSISLVKTMRPDEDELDKIKSNFPHFEILPNYDIFFNSAQIFFNNEINNEITFSFILNYNESSFDNSLIKSGDVSKAIEWNDVIINESAYELIKDRELHFQITYENKVKDDIKYIVDYLEIDKKLNIIAIADEFDFLSVPKIYFDYEKIDRFLGNVILENLSDFKKVNVSWKDLVVESLPGDELSSYSMRCFLKDIRYKSQIEELQKTQNESIKIENDSLTVKEAISSLTTAASYGLDIFLFIALIGSVLIVGVFTYSAYVDDKKESSILSCLGATNYDIVGIYASESIIVTFISFLLATVFSFLLENPLNLLLTNLLDIPNLVRIPFKQMNGIRGLLPLGILFGSLIVTLLFSAIPILINKSVSIKKELSDL